MDYWKISLDKYLTTPPNDDYFDTWCDDILDNKFTNTFYNENEDWVNEYDGQCNKWFNKLFNRNKDTTKAAQIIERLFSITIAKNYGKSISN